MTPPILVIGHRNPDTDAICSALAYAHLYTAQTDEPALACHLDTIGPEATWVLAHFGVDPPVQIQDVYLRAGDIMRMDPPRLRPETTLREAGLLLRERKLRALPVTDAAGVLVGVLARDALADRYLDQLQPSYDPAPTAVGALARALGAELLIGDPATTLAGHLWITALSPGAIRDHVSPGDTVVAGDQPDTHIAALEAGAACLVIADGAQPTAELIALAKTRGAALINVSERPFTAALRVYQAAPVSSAMNPDAAAAQTDDLLTDALGQIRSGGLAALPVVDAERHLMGLLLRRDLADQTKRRVILTDHNHPDQAAPGVSESEIIAIIDHHNLGGLRTAHPAFIRCEPVGCTCTLIAELYRSAGITPPAPVAGIMLSAILSDTVALRSATTTPRDKVAVTWLAQICGEDAETLARSMFRARMPDPPPPPEWWVARDWKVFQLGEKRVGIGQIELVDVENSAPPADALQEALAAAVRGQGLDGGYLLLTDILAEGSTLLADGPMAESLASRAFSAEFADGRLALPGVMSRKKQVVPPLASAA